MTPIKQILEEQEQEYRDKYDKYEEMYMFAVRNQDVDLENLCLRRLSGLKMLIDRMPDFKEKMKHKIKKYYNED